MTSSVGLVSQSIWEHVAILLRRLSLLSAALKEIRTGGSRFPCLLPTRSLKGTILLVECSGLVCIDGGKRGSVGADWFWKLALWRRHRKDPAWVVGAQRHLYSLGSEVVLVFGRADGGMYRFSLFSCVSTSSQLLGRFRNDLLFLIADRSGKLEIRRAEYDMTIAVGICRCEEEPEWSLCNCLVF